MLEESAAQKHEVAANTSTVKAQGEEVKKNAAVDGPLVRQRVQEVRHGERAADL